MYFAGLYPITAMAQSFNTALSRIAALYARHLAVPVTYNTIREKVEEDSYYPSLYSLSRVFDKYKVENAAYRVEPEHFGELEAPFIAYLNNQPAGKDFVLVTDITGDRVSYRNGSKLVHTGREQFFKDWEQIVFVAQATEQSGDPGFAIAQQEERKARRMSVLRTMGGLLLFILAVCLFFIPLESAARLPAGLLLLTKTLGLLTTLLLLVYEVDEHNAFVRNICTSGRQTNCGAVLHSKGAMLAGLSWSDAGFFYFAGSTLFLLLPGLPWTGKMPWLAASAMAASLYIPFSIWYQWRVVKQWCPLCLAVQAVLLAELTWSIFAWIPAADRFPRAAVSVPVLLSAMACLLLPVVACPALKKLFLQAREVPAWRSAYKRLLYHPETFDNLLQQQPEAPDGYERLGISIGNPAAAHTILKVCNPYCGPCARLHPLLDDLIAHNPNVKVQIIFTASNNDQDPRGAPVRHLLAIAAQGDAAATQKALDDWYLAPKRDYSLFAGRYPMNGELKAQEAQVTAMEQWCTAADIQYTPTLFVNGRKLPENYSIEELKHIL